jgi:thymidylate synthase (FAD)
MKAVKPGYKILTCINAQHTYRAIENAGRICYKSKGAQGSSEAFVRRLVASQHYSVLEHVAVSVRIVCDRGVSHELVRHRIASYSQESTRFCNYEGGISFVHPFYWLSMDQIKRRELLYSATELVYSQEIAEGVRPQIARGVLPTSLKTELVMTMNLRQWREFFFKRAIGSTGKPHPQMLEITVPMLAEFTRKLPAIFDSVKLSVDKALNC